MLCCSTLFLLLDSFVRFADAADPVQGQESAQWWQSTEAMNVRDRPDISAPVRGKLAPNQSFAVYGLVSGDDCAPPGWAIVEAGGFACLQHAAVSQSPPEVQPSLVQFYAPAPADAAEYIRTGKFPLVDNPPLLPYIYGKRWRGWEGNVWSSLESWSKGQPPASQLDFNHTYHFINAVDTATGRVLIRPDGTVVPEAEVFLFPVTRFHGRSLAVFPLRGGDAAAWVAVKRGLRARSAPRASGKVLAVLPFQTSVSIESGSGQWAKLSTVSTEIPAQYVDRAALRIWHPLARPEEVGVSEMWLDVDLSQQMLALLIGETPIFVTLISSGVDKHETPTGMFRIYDKAATGTMSSLVDADEPYHVEEVPWIIHFRPRYALHAAFWHSGFGRPASHGCVNLAPTDAKFIFDQISPSLPLGFSSINVAPPEQGTLLRIR